MGGWCLVIGQWWLNGNNRTQQHWGTGMGTSAPRCFLVLQGANLGFEASLWQASRLDVRRKFDSDPNFVREPVEGSSKAFTLSIVEGPSTIRALSLRGVFTCCELLLLT